MAGPKTAPSNKSAAPAQTKLRLTCRGKTFEKEIHNFIEAMAGKVPNRIQRYSTTINGERYPIRQVVACATGLPSIAITSQDAYKYSKNLGSPLTPAKRRLSLLADGPPPKRLRKRPWANRNLWVAGNIRCQ